MNILYDHQIFESQAYGGISRYFYELIKGFRNNEIVDLELALEYSDNYYLKNDNFFSSQIKRLKTFENCLPGFKFKGKGKVYEILKKVGIINDTIGKNKKIADMSFVKIWLHLVWTTKNKEPYLKKKIRYGIFKHIRNYAETKGIHIDFINGHFDHVHCLLSLNAAQSIAEIMQLIKGQSSFWINKNNLIGLIDLF